MYTAWPLIHAKHCVVSSYT